MPDQTKTWCVTGASNGIGRALAEAALARGDRVFGTVRREEDMAAFEALSPGRAVALRVDMTDAAQIERAARRLADAGRLDILVNNAGMGMVGSVEESSIEEARRIFDINVFGLLRMTQAVLPQLRGQGGGRIVNISSGVGLTGLAGMPIYSASKGAVESLTEALSGEVAPFGIKVCLVEPGAVQTGFATRHALEAARRMPEYESLTGQRRAGLEKFYAGAVDASTVAQAIIDLADEPDPPLRQLVGGVVIAAERKRDAMQRAIDRAR